MTTHSPTPCLHQGTLTPPKSEYIPADNGRPGFHNRSFQSGVLPKDPVPRELHDPRCLYFPSLYFLSLCVGVGACVKICASPFNVFSRAECKWLALQQE